MKTTRVSIRIYFLIWIALMLLLAATWGASRLNLGAANTIVAMTIAFVKMLLVLLFFMHLRYNSRITWLFAAAGFVWLLIMISFTMTDYLTRGRVRTSDKTISYLEQDSKSGQAR